MKKPGPAQLELIMQTPEIKDRNHAQGGRSFYFFDFDDNVIHLPTLLFVFHKKTGEEKPITTHEFAKMQFQLGKEEPWLDYEIRLDDQTGSFRRFREKKKKWFSFEKGLQPLEEDLFEVFKKPFEEWRGPSWNFFQYAVHNQRPVSIITARGHHPETMKRGIELLRAHGFIGKTPNYLSVYPVSHRPTRLLLGDKEIKWHASRLKQEAIKFSVDAAFRKYGQNPGHRFGMSDDDPVNLKLIVDAMRDLKKSYPQNSFFVIDTHGGRLMKQEIFADHVVESKLEPKHGPGHQLSFFE